MKKRAFLYLPALFMLAGVTACSSPGDVTEDTADVVVDAPTEAEPTETADSSVAEAFANITDCAPVEAALAPFIGGLVADPGNIADEWGVNCSWESSEDETDLANVRTVTVSLIPKAESEPLPDPQLIVEMLNGEVIESEWVAENEGIAYTVKIGTEAIGAVVTTVSFPGVEVSVSGGAWANMQPLDGPASLAVAQQLLG